MEQGSYLLIRGSTWQYRRRLPGTCCVIPIPLGTSDRETAVKLAARLTAEFDMTLDRLLRSDHTIPDELMAKYFDFCLRRLILELTKQRRWQRMSGDITAKSRRTEEMRLIITKHMIEDGLSPTLPPHRIAEFDTPEDLEIAMLVQQQQFSFISRSVLKPHFKMAASTILDSKDRKPHQLYQLKETFMHACAEALKVVDKSPQEMAKLLPRARRSCCQGRKCNRRQP